MERPDTIRWIRPIWRRVHWVTQRAGLGTLRNNARALLEMLARRQRMKAWPAVLKIDVTAVCNLQCPVCLHADASALPELAGQRLSGHMGLDDFRRIVDEVRGHTAAVSLYYFGDPYMHPQIDALCRVAFDAGLNVHLSSNFSFRFDHERIASICRSGVTHLSVCVDGFSQDTYGQPRIGGKLDQVLSNLERVLDYRQVHGLRYPRVEVQYIKFQHNLHEVDEAMAYFKRIGVDHVEVFWGMVSNCVEQDADTIQIRRAKTASVQPHCIWPFTALTIKYDGEVLPCCIYRQGPQYAEDGETRGFGNVFEQGLRAIWDGPLVQQARRLALDPSRAEREPELREHFCYGCPELFDADYVKPIRRAPDYPVERGASD